MYVYIGICLPVCASILREKQRHTTPSILHLDPKSPI